jgi:hypothetical protein
VEVAFVDPELGTLRQTFDNDKITKPRTSSSFSALRTRLSHPCHIRFADLTRFVYFTKSERYDVLAQLMGFQPQVEVQKALRRVEKSLSDRVEALEAKARDGTTQLKSLLGIEEKTGPGVFGALSRLLGHHGIAAEATEQATAAGVEHLKHLVERDPQAVLLAGAKDLSKRLKTMPIPHTLVDSIGDYCTLAKPFKEDEAVLSRLLLAKLYDVGSQAASEVQGEPCPLCGQAFPGNLRAHLKDELQKLQYLRANLDSVIKAQRTAVQALEPLRLELKPIRDLAATLPSEPYIPALNGFLHAATGLEALCLELLTMLKIAPHDLSVSALENLRSRHGGLESQWREYHNTLANCSSSLDAASLRLESDTRRVALVNDFQIASRSITVWRDLSEQIKLLLKAVQVLQGFSKLVEHFVDASIKDVTSRFATISDDVTTYFELLEQQTPGITKPALRVLEDQDRSVVLEVQFYGEAIFPAYRYLSESQLSSFGLAVFLASVKRFNPGFPFILLDDVVNSLDGHKRPQLIAILKKHFASHQVLLLTHDSVWRDRVFRELPKWRRVHFKRFEIAIGPIPGDSSSTLTEIEGHITDDRPRLAGQVLGPYMEDVLQDICEAFEVEMKFNRRNEYTLEPLLDRLRIRVQGKLGQSHALSIALVELQELSGFRNLAAHAKNPDIELTPPEMSAVTSKWRFIEESTRCSEAHCEEILKYHKPSFRCGCGKSTLERV